MVNFARPGVVVTQPIILLDNLIPANLRPVSALELLFSLYPSRSPSSQRATSLAKNSHLHYGVPGDTPVIFGLLSQTESSVLTVISGPAT